MNLSVPLHVSLCTVLVSLFAIHRSRLVVCTIGILVRVWSSHRRLCAIVTWHETEFISIMEIFFWVVFEQICDLEVWNWYPREGIQMAVFCVHFTTCHGGDYYIGSFTGTCILEDFILLRFAVTVRCNQLTLLCHSQHLKITPFLHAVFNLVKVQGQPQLNLCTQVGVLMLFPKKWELTFHYGENSSYNASLSSPHCLF
ncbi:hypothetical protein CY35_02G186000 [Sphagnum magellanicum]|jgi:hypothetical protein|nr:hypothetical protein CY35_02G186000 [Sphagnum magellanicum]